MKIQTDLPKDLHKQLKMHQLRYNFILLSDALIDVVKRFFAEEDYDYFLNKNQEIKKSGPKYLKELKEKKK